MGVLEEVLLEVVAGDVWESRRAAARRLQRRERRRGDARAEEALCTGALDHGRKKASDRELLCRSDLEEEAPARWIEWGAGCGSSRIEERGGR